MTDREIAIRKKLRDNLPHFALKCLKIRAKKAVISEGKALISTKHKFMLTAGSSSRA